jgi:hypothetical protein
MRRVLSGLTNGVLLSWLRQTHHCCTAVLAETDIQGRCASHPDAAAVAAEEGRCWRSYWRRSCWLPHESRMSVVLVLEFRHMRHRMMLYQLRRCYKGRFHQSVWEWSCPPKVSYARTLSPFIGSLVYTYVTTASCHCFCFTVHRSNVVCWTDWPSGMAAAMSGHSCHTK